MPRQEKSHSSKRKITVAELTQDSVEKVGQGREGDVSTADV